MKGLENGGRFRDLPIYWRIVIGLCVIVMLLWAALPDPFWGELIRSAFR
jgi:hypothetical protein